MNLILNIQIGFEADRRRTDCIQFLEPRGVNFMTQFLWKIWTTAGQ